MFVVHDISEDETSHLDKTLGEIYEAAKQTIVYLPSDYLEDEDEKALNCYKLVAIYVDHSVYIVDFSNGSAGISYMANTFDDYPSYF